MNKLNANNIFINFLEKFIVENKIGIKIINKESNEDGFIIDFETNNNISENTLPIIEGKIKKQISKDSKAEISKVKFFKLRGVSGLELKNKSNRIFGLASFTKEEFDKKLSEIIDREERDHRKIAKDLDLFFIDELSGKGMPIWLEDGLILKNNIKDFINKQEQKYGSSQIETPVLGSIDLYKTSGHYQHYKDSMFPEMQIEKDETFILRPMACPHHILVYKRKPRSYRELPVRFSENVKQYRYEYSGSLLGLERVRGMELTDSHIFLREDQLYDEIKKGFNLIKETLKKFNIEIEYIELALHDSKNTKKYHGNKDLWNKSEKILEKFLKENNINYKAIVGEAAFYGPKIDIQIKTALGHIITVSTIQLDFSLPEKFKLEYINSDNKKETPIMIHRGLIGTYERFISILLEQTKGVLPMWLAPKQAVIIPINKVHNKYCEKLLNDLLESGVRVKLDNSDERLSNKIRIYQESKTKVQIIIGDDEVKNNKYTYRLYGDEKSHTVSLNKLKEIFIDK